MYSRKQIEWAYLNDPMVHAFVESIVSVIKDLHLSPAEVRAIVMFAVEQYETTRIHPTIEPKDKTNDR